MVVLLHSHQGFLYHVCKKSIGCFIIPSLGNCALWHSLLCTATCTQLSAPHTSHMEKMVHYMTLRMSRTAVPISITIYLAPSISPGSILDLFWVIADEAKLGRLHPYSCWRCNILIDGEMSSRYTEVAFLTIPETIWHWWWSSIFRVPHLAQSPVCTFCHWISWSGTARGIHWP